MTGFGMGLVGALIFVTLIRQATAKTKEEKDSANGLWIMSVIAFLFFYFI